MGHPADTVHSFVRREYGKKAKVTEFPKKLSPLKELLASVSSAQSWRPRISAGEVASFMEKFAREEECMFEFK